MTGIVNITALSSREMACAIRSPCGLSLATRPFTSKSSKWNSVLRSGDQRITINDNIIRKYNGCLRVRLGYSNTIRVDNDSEFISRDLDLWAYANDVTLDFSRPGKPIDNGFIETFNSKLRAECLNAHWLLTLADAREKPEEWHRYYNEDRPPSAIGYNVPIAL